MPRLGTSPGTTCGTRCKTFSNHGRGSVLFGTASFQTRAAYVISLRQEYLHDEPDHRQRAGAA